MTIAFRILLVCYLAFLLLTILNRFLPRWFCDKLGWHLAPREVGFDGANVKGICPRCGKRVMQDSQGNWFEVERQEIRKEEDDT